MTSHTLILLTMIVFHRAPSFSYPSYKMKIPNGDRVPNPCTPSDMWNGVGHLVKGGGGARNPFGRDFANNHRRWTKNLCMMDSDGDGRSNGEELGDPLCKWMEGHTAQSGVEISHPGICNPHDDTECKAKNRMFKDLCQPELFTCPHILSPDVKNFTLKFPRTKVPSDETNYFCMTFNVVDFGVDVSQAYHVIATQIHVDNAKILHHVLYYECNQFIQLRTSTEPTVCDMAPRRECGKMIGGWTVGALGECYHSDTGFKMGHGGFKSMSLQFHWNNQDRRSDYYDGSGVTFYYTEKLRPYDATILTVGREMFSIPPKQPEYIVKGTCLSKCSREVTRKTVYIVGVVNHMHYLGRRVHLELKRDGELVKKFARDDFDYNNPKFHIFKTPIEFTPGDELQLVCNYTSVNTNIPTSYGASTSDEMCYSFVTVYPSKHLKLQHCIQPFNCDPCVQLIDQMKLVLREACLITTCAQTCPAVTEQLLTETCSKKFLDEFSINYQWYLHETCHAQVCNYNSSCINNSDNDANEICTEMEVFLYLSEQTCINTWELSVMRKIIDRPCFRSKLYGMIKDGVIDNESNLYASLNACGQQLCGKQIHNFFAEYPSNGNK